MNKKIEIYIHIPFCVKKCAYCDFLSCPADDKTKDRYVQALCREIEWSKDCLKEYLVDTVFIGGGTPSILEGKQIEKIMETLRSIANVSSGAEITVECNPGTLDKEKLSSYLSAGINRICLGLQSANEEELKSTNSVDFNDMIVLATDYIKNNSIEKYKYIKVSEEFITLTSSKRVTN